MLFLFMRIIMSVFPFIKEMCLSVDKGNYSKVAIMLTALLIVMIAVNVIGSKVVFVTVTQRNIAIKENKELKRQIDLLNAEQCKDNKQLLYIAELTLELRACRAGPIK